MTQQMTSSSQSSSRSQTPVPEHPALDMAAVSITARLDNSITPQTESWVRESAEQNIFARLAGGVVHFDLPHLEILGDLGESISYPRSVVLSTSCPSSMAPAVVHQAASAHPPSLYSCYTEATPTETSISTGLANQFEGVPLLEENNGVLELPRTQQRIPQFECAFWFLSCGYISTNQEEWTTHCESHFRGEEPPRKVQCPLCDWVTTSSDGWTAWAHRMQHLAQGHTMLGQTLRTSRPDFDLFHHLWCKRLIDTEDLKELNGGNHNLERPPGNFVQTNTRPSRRERDERRHRRQHVTMPRQSGRQRR